MRSSKAWTALLLAAALGSSACGSGKDNSSSYPTSNPTNGRTLPALSGANVLPLSVNGTACAANSYPNKPCTTVKICAPGSTTNCQTLTDVLVDTGSFGLRVFKSVLNASLVSALTPVTTGGHPVAECIQFGDGTADWGPIQSADVVLGSEPAVTVPMQVIDSTYASVPASCPSPDKTPADAGFNAILGVGLFASDCGATCASKANNQVYFTCAGATCTGTALSTASQVQNPVSLLPKDGNGVILELPSVPLGGALSAEGYLVLGIGTESNNVPSGVITFPADPDIGEFTATFNGATYSSFLDSGSNANFFKAPSASTLPECGSAYPDVSNFFCPSSVVSLSAVTNGTSGSPNSIVPFQVGHAGKLLGSGNSVFVEFGADGALGTGQSEVFDLGLPFYLGRNVYVGFEAKSSSLGTGPYWAY